MNLCIIQARTNSTRLPGKAMLEINGKKLFKHVYDTVANTGLWNVVIAVPVGDTDIINACKNENVPFYEGSESDVLSRYYHCAKAYKATRIMRLTSDCPAIPMDTIVLASNVKSDFVSNSFDKRTYPDGWDVEIMSFKILEWLYKTATDLKDREHVTKFFYTNLNKLGKTTIARLDLPLNLSDIKYSIDTQEDFDRVKKLMGGTN